MSAKRQRIPHVPGFTEVIDAPSSSSSPNRTTLDNATEPVSLATLAGDIAEIKLEIGVIVDWLHALETTLANDD